MNEAIEKLASRIIVSCGVGTEYPCPHDEPVFGYEKCQHEDKDICIWQIKQAEEFIKILESCGYSLPDPDRLTRISDEEIKKHGYGWMQNYDYEIKELLDAQLQHDRETLEKR